MFWTTNNEANEKILALKEKLNSSLISLSSRMSELEGKIDPIMGFQETLHNRIKSLELEISHYKPESSLLSKISNEQLCISMEIDDIKGALTNISRRLLLLESIPTDLDASRQEIKRGTLKVILPRDKKRKEKHV
jgi:hypothetical protein